MEQEKLHNFDLSSYVAAKETMIGKNASVYQDTILDQLVARFSRNKKYTYEEVIRILEQGTLNEKRTLSNYFFNSDGYYKQIILYYATLLKYAGILIPNPSYNKELSTPSIAKRYYKALDAVIDLDVKTLASNWITKQLVEGAYYGLRIENDTCFSVFDLPSEFCRSRFKDIYGNDLIEFDLRYFETITDNSDRESALKLFPKFIAKAYREFSRGSRTSPWVKIDSEFGFCFDLLGGEPPFLSIIKASLDYEDALTTERIRDLEEIRKIIVQQIPHLSDGRLLFEPDEAAEMHSGAVEMLSGNKNISVLTTYADVDAVQSKTSVEGTSNILGRAEKNIYSQAGVSSEIFSSTGSSTLSTSTANDLSFVMLLMSKIDRYITRYINSLYANGNIHFTYHTLPISYYNNSEYLTNALKAAQNGFSALLPALALDLNQKEILNIKDLENDVLELGKKLRPLQSSYTQSSDSSGESGRPKVPDDQKADQTIANERSLDNQAEGGIN